MDASCQRAPDALREEQDERHEDRANDERPGLGENAQAVLQDEIGRRPHERPEEGAGAAEQRHHDDLPRGRPVERLDRDDREPQRLQRPRQPRQRGREHEREQPDPIDVVPAGDRAVAVLANRLQDGAEGRVEDAPEPDHRQPDQRKREVVEGERALEREREEGQPRRQLRDAPQAVVAAGQVGEVEDDEVQELGEREREHREVDPAAPQAEEANEGAPGGGRTETEAEPAPDRPHSELGQRNPRPVGAQPKVRGVAEREEARVPVEEVEPDGEEAVDEDLGRERLVRNQEGEHRKEEQECQDGMGADPGGEPRRHSRRPASPSSPLGRTSKTTAMTMNTMISESLGAIKVVRPTTSPIMRPANTAPARLPMPPTTTTTNASITTVTPISAYTPRIGPASTPARPARRVPIPNTSRRMRPRSMPSACTIRGSREPARTISPRSVRLRNSQSATSTAAVTPMTKSR